MVQRNCQSPHDPILTALSAVRSRRLPVAIALLGATLPIPAFASQGVETMDVTTTEAAAPETVYDDTWLSIGIGAAALPSYEGSDDTVVSPIPLIQGKIGPVRINPRPAGIALDFVPKPESGPRLSGGLSLRYRANRTGDVRDEVVERAAELDSALEVGPTIGVSFPGTIHGRDSLSLNLDTRWDVLGAHDGFVVEPNATYFSPLSRGIAVSLSVGAKFADDNFADYYFSVDEADAAATGLPTFEAEGGLINLNSALLVGFDLGGDLTDGGPAIFVAGGYTRLMRDAADTPFTSIRGSADQFVGAVGFGYTF
ncbi:MipA/OmpV family protein [Erythrobacter sp.]|uniref:MipA/OmpV family protein n=1 Tax=Erythrobacter sp. TaxID=1042 RepID=UPI002EBB0261|nr:MipA/OmpV family protein [Erythrobacter sp.]